MALQPVENNQSLVRRIWRLMIGAARSPQDPNLSHKLSLVAFFAWVGLGADGMSSSCYGPPAAFEALHSHPYLGVFVGLATALTIIVISASYYQIIELFPTGGGGYLVASKLLSPGCGMVSGCALLVDYVLTITLSIASGADALFSLLPPSWQPFRVPVAVGGVLILTVLNMRGVRESVVPLVPIFLVFVLTHIFAILYALISHAWEFPVVASQTASQVRSVVSQSGFLALLLLLLRSYSLGAGTYTGIEAVSNGLPNLREPRVQTGKRTMRYMAASLAFMALGLMLAYMLYQTAHVEGKTLNAVLFEQISANWSGRTAYVFVLVTLVSEAVILFVAAQTGFLGGPRVLANMALDRWVPTRFAMLSDRLVTQDGILLMAGAALVLMLLTGGSVAYLVVLYSINVFITFVLSQLGMVRHWWVARGKRWIGNMLINGVGLMMTFVILFSMVFLKFFEGGWITLLITGLLVVLMLLIRRHYTATWRQLRRLDELAQKVASEISAGTGTAVGSPKPLPAFRPEERTAIILVNGYNGLGLHTLAAVMRLFGGTFKNIVFLQVGVLDAGNFKGAEQVENLKDHVQKELDQYVAVIRHSGYYAEGVAAIGTDVMSEVMNLAPKLQERFPQAVFFGGQLVFQDETFFTRWLHNNVVMALQRRFYRFGLPFVMLPIRV